MGLDLVESPEGSLVVLGTLICSSGETALLADFFEEFLQRLEPSE